MCSSAHYGRRELKDYTGERKHAPINFKWGRVAFAGTATSALLFAAIATRGQDTGPSQKDIARVEACATNELQPMIGDPNSDVIYNALGDCAARLSVPMAQPEMGNSEKSIAASYYITATS